MADNDATDDTPKVSDTDTGSGSSEDESETEQVETLVAGRERRKTAGNRYDRDMLLDEAAAAVDEDADEVTLLFADNEEEEDEEFKSSDEDEDADMSSSDDDDQGPNVAPDDLEGEKEIQKQAKQERAKKRRADLALTSVAGLRKKLKTDPTRPAALSAPAKPSKKKERVTWVHDPDSGRSSLRKQTIAHRAETIARLKESEAQSKKMKALKEQRDRERAKDAPKELTQEDRLAEAARVERQNAKSLNRWETMEKKRQEEQAAKLAALKDRKLDGPVISWWSARAKWIGPKLHKIGTKDAGDVIEGGAETKKRGRKSKAFLEQQAAVKEAATGTTSQKTTTEMPTLLETPAPTAVTPAPSLLLDQANDPARKPATEPATGPTTEPSKEPTTEPTMEPTIEPTTNKIPDDAPASETKPPPVTHAAPQEEEDSFLKGIHEYATLEDEENAPGINPDNSAPRQSNVQQPKEQSPQEQSNIGTTSDTVTSSVNQQKQPEEEKSEEQPSIATTSNTISTQPIQATQRENEVSQTPQDDATKPDTTPGLQSTNPTQTKQITTTPSTADEAPSAPEPSSAPQPPPVAETLPVPKPAPAPEVAAVPEPEPIVENSTRNLVILEKFDELSNEARQEYSFFFNTRKAAKPVKHSQELCPITTQPVRYRDASTGMGYANVVGYKKLQELKRHGFVWSSMLGCYVGRDGGAVARGVPEGFVDK
ncbi:hypothetical protein A1O1_04032 [Capronia coronata CBS 617.96]|uniref:Vps72/YL1 C-terminal domain-containing protein n=1 Tax=Capronia coronata CBS 617.96 TaxID=1182541 RepID=W9YNX8_9EURO|nr:uncharacterized protein A1O1_04032 [Capronia coronata CBS 617.96]EXJ90926.1 hypothetical protein A1O1_04032 [Capronia coronata CBS 617.96]